MTSGTSSLPATRTSRIGRSPGDVSSSTDLPAAILRDGVRVAQSGISVQQPPAEALEPHRVLDGQPQMPQLDLAVRARQRQRARNRAPVVVFLDQALRGLFALRIGRREGEPRRRARRQPDRLPEADDRIEDRTGRVRQRRAEERVRTIERAAATDEAGPVRLVLRGDADAPASAEDV